MIKESYYYILGINARPFDCLMTNNFSCDISVIQSPGRNTIYSTQFGSRLAVGGNCKFFGGIQNESLDNDCVMTFKYVLC